MTLACSSPCLTSFALKAVCMVAFAHLPASNGETIRNIVVGSGEMCATSPLRSYCSRVLYKKVLFSSSVHLLIIDNRPHLFQQSFNRLFFFSLLDEAPP